MRTLKYVIKKREAITFPKSIEHDTFRYMPLTSAGFVDIWHDENGIRFRCYGLSTSLGLKANVKKDTMVFEKLWGRCL
jgi:hypothetical protein